MYILSTIVRSAERFLNALTKSVEPGNSKKNKKRVSSDDSEDELGFSCHESITSKSLVNHYGDDSPIGSMEIELPVSDYDEVYHYVTA